MPSPAVPQPERNSPELSACMPRPAASRVATQQHQRHDRHRTPPPIAASVSRHGSSSSPILNPSDTLAALVLFDGCIVRDGVLRLPGGTEIPLPAGIVTIDDALASHQRGQGLVWGGAVHLVDVTDTAGKVTRRTGAEHRKYHLHFLCRAEAPAPEPVVSPSQSLGTDWGVVVPLVCSNGTAYSRYTSDAQQHANPKRHLEAKQLQQSMGDKTEGSRRHTKQQRRRQNLLAKNTDVRVINATSPKRSSQPPRCAKSCWRAPTQRTAKADKLT